LLIVCLEECVDGRCDHRDGNELTVGVEPLGGAVAHPVVDLDAGDRLVGPIADHCIPRHEEDVVGRQRGLGSVADTDGSDAGDMDDQRVESLVDSGCHRSRHERRARQGEGGVPYATYRDIGDHGLVDERVGRSGIRLLDAPAAEAEPLRHLGALERGAPHAPRRPRRMRVGCHVDASRAVPRGAGSRNFRPDPGDS